MKKNKVTAKKSAKNATVKTALIKSLVKKDLESLASGGSAVSCSMILCK